MSRTRRPGGVLGLAVPSGLERDDAWTGPVERRAERDYRERSTHLTWRCQNPSCGQFTMHGAWRTGRCNFCGHPRPQDDRSNPLLHSTPEDVCEVVSPSS